jgi:putative hydrolase of the HAD superfamily
VARVSVEAVIFDWGGTLTPWHEIDIHETWRCVARVVAPERVEELAAELLAADDAAWARCRSEGVSMRFDEVLATCGIEASDELLAAHCVEWEPHTIIDPEAPHVLAGLRERGIKVGVLSNTLWPGHQHESWFVRDGVAGLFDGAVYSSEIPWTKPHPEAFRAALHAVGVTAPERAVFVGDRPFEDIHGAKAAGLRAVLIPHSTIPDYQRGPVDGEADAEIERLADLLPLVDVWR